MSMATMVMIAGRKRDSRGRYMGDMDGGEMRRYNGMDDGEMRRYDAYDAEMRNRRGNNQYTRERRNAMDDGRYDIDDPDMRYEDNDMRIRERRIGEYNRTESRDRPDMGGEGWVTWGNANRHMPAWEPPERYGLPGSRWGGNITDMRKYRDQGARSHMGAEVEPKPVKPKIGFGEEAPKLGKQKAVIGEEAAKTKRKHIDRATAEKWVRSMIAGEGKPAGELISWEDAKRLAKERGIPTDGQLMIDFYAAINMKASDDYAVAKKYDLATEDYFADLAMAFLYDSDGKSPTEKLYAYYEHVVPHDEEDD